MGDDRKLPEFDDDSETQKRLREVRILINILVPDPHYQPTFFSDRASVFDISDELEEQIRKKLEFYLGKPLTVPLTQPLWKLVDYLKETIPGWPEKIGT